MATLANNALYFDIDGTQVDAYFTAFGYDPSIDTVETTAGSSTTWKTFAVGLKSSSASLTIVYDTTLATTHLQLIAPGAHTITFGPEGNASGKPKHVQAVIITGDSFSMAVSKDVVAHSVSMQSAAAPTTDIMAGGVWA